MNVNPEGRQPQLLFVQDHSQAGAPCRAHTKKRRAVKNNPALKLADVWWRC